MIPTRVIVPVSAGKDSQACARLAVERYGKERVLMVHQHTGFDHPLTYAHLEYMRDHYGVPLINVRSAKYATVPDVMYGEVMIPSAQARMCTRQLKTGPWFDWLKQQEDRDTLLVMLGMRAQESQGRKESYGHLANDDEFSMQDVSSEAPASCHKVRTMLPIVEWSTSEVFDYLRGFGDKVNPLYSRGHRRVGCYPCVMASKRDFALAARDPVGREHIIQFRDAINFVKRERVDARGIDWDNLVKIDLDAVLAKKVADPFGFGFDFTEELDDETVGGCSWCTM